MKTRRHRNQDRVDAGLVSDPKQLQAIQHENDTLDRRISDLEDVELDVMERLEQAQSERDGLASEMEALALELDKTAQARNSATDEIDAQRAEASAERELLAADIPPDLLALYGRLRSQLGGVAVGAIHQKRCEGCRLDIGAAELARMVAAPSDEVLRCEECNRILVRTTRSGI
ncbi:MAG: nucleic acid-binding protein [Propionibacteriales bacterium]|nr:nucleic acid-binding protein [Propionibacteriales bacterium]